MDTGTVLVVLVGFGLSKVYQKYRRKQKLLQECERLPESVYFKVSNSSSSTIMSMSV